jgi:hypothetical protein
MNPSWRSVSGFGEPEYADAVKDPGSNELAPAPTLVPVVKDACHRVSDLSTILLIVSFLMLVSASLLVQPKPISSYGNAAIRLKNGRRSMILLRG